MKRILTAMIISILCLSMLGVLASKVAAATATITFYQTGVGSDFTGTVVVIDTVSYHVADFPITFTTWGVGETHYFAFLSPLSPLTGSGWPNVTHGYCWWNTTGLSTLQSDPLIVSGDGTVNATYGLIGDLDRDNDKVGLDDLAILAAAWHSTPTSSNWDARCAIAYPFNVIGLSDLSTVATHWNDQY
jgi:hypothetical protein